MKKILLMVAAFFVLVSMVAAKELTVEQSLRNAAQEIAEKIDGKVKTIIVISIHSKDTKDNLWALNDYLVSRLTHEFTNILEETSVAERDEYTLALIQQELNFQRSGEVSDETIYEISQALGADCQISGEIQSTSRGWDLLLKATTVESKKQLASVMCEVSKKDKEIKYQVKKSKENPEPVYKMPSKRVIQSENAMTQSAADTAQGLMAEMIDTNGNAVSVLHPNDIIRFRVSSAKNAYLAILCIDAKKEETWLPIQNNYIKAGESRIFPDIQGAVLRVENGVFGKESVTVYAAAAESDLPNQTKMMGTRGFSFEREKGEVTETVIEYQVKK